MLAKCKETCSFSDHTKSRSFGSVVINLFVAITRLLVLSLLMNDNEPYLDPCRLHTSLITDVKVLNGKLVILEHVNDLH